MKIFILTKEIREEKFYNVEIIGVFDNKNKAEIFFASIVSELINDGYENIQLTDSVALLKYEETQINLTIIESEVK